MIGGLAVDYANAVRVKAQLQTTVDAAALAAVLDLPDRNVATLSGMAIAESYFPDSALVIGAADFVYGTWDTESRSFIEDTSPYNTVRVSAGRQSSRGNPLPNYLLKLAGFNSLNVGVTAVARAKGNSACKSGGFFSSGRVFSGSNNDYLDTFCLYGEQG